MSGKEERLALWASCETYFKAALEYEHRPITLEMVRSEFLAGHSDILRGIRSALLVKVVFISGNRHLLAYLGGGELTEMVSVLFPRAEIVGRHAGCQSVLIDGRKGWARALRRSGYLVITKNDGWWLVAKALRPETFQQRVKSVTAINYTINPTFIALATDTLVTDASDWFPANLTPKAAFIPHLDALITSTTYLSLLRNCYNYALQAPVRDIEGLAANLPAICRQTFQETMVFCQTMHPPEEDFSWAETCAVSLFGWSPTQGRLIGLKFALKDNFEPEYLADGVYTQPRVRGIPETITAANVLDLCEITRQQQELEMRLTAVDRNAIGGDILLWELRADTGGIVISRVQRVYRFPTYDEDLKFIREKAA